MFIKRDHKNQCSCQQGPSGHGRRVKNENLYAYKQRTNAKIVGGERDETFAPHLLPRVIIILDKEITNFENEISPEAQKVGTLCIECLKRNSGI